MPGMVGFVFFLYILHLVQRSLRYFMDVLSVCADFDPLPHIPVVEMVSEDEASEVENPSQFPPKLASNTGWVRSDGRACVRRP